VSEFLLRRLAGREVGAASDTALPPAAAEEP